MLRRQELLNDITDTVGVAFLGVTVGCARCHDHKFDPILHKDYYRLQAFFANTRIEDECTSRLRATAAEAGKQQNAVWEAKTDAIRDEMATLAEARLRRLLQRAAGAFPRRNPGHHQHARRRSARHINGRCSTRPRRRSRFRMRRSRAKLQRHREDSLPELKRSSPLSTTVKPTDPAVAQVMIDASAAAPPTFVLRGGAWDAPLDLKSTRLPIDSRSEGRRDRQPAAMDSTGRRAALANWIASPANPLTARVAVNRIWQYHFGRGIVGTPGDFGIMGERPTNPDLLNWLTATFIEQGWSQKKLHRMILLSSAYRQSSLTTPETREGRHHRP